MVPLPPPPDLSTPEARRRVLGRRVAAPHADAPVHALPGQLTPGWRWLLTIGWASILVGLMAVGGAGDVIGKRPWWLDGVLVVVPFVVPVAALVTAYTNHRVAIWVAAGGVVSLGATALVDVRDSPGAAAATAVLALAAALVTVASAAGRVPRLRNDR